MWFMTGLMLSAYGIAILCAVIGTFQLSGWLGASLVFFGIQMLLVKMLENMKESEREKLREATVDKAA